MKSKQFVIVLEDELFADGLDVTCWGYDVEDAVNGLRITYKEHGLPLPKVISTSEIEPVVDKEYKSFLRLLHHCFTNTL